MQDKRSKRTNVIPGFGISMGITITLISILIIFPLLSIMVYGFTLSFEEFIDVIVSANVKNALITSIWCSLTAAFINSIFGLILAWSLVKFSFPLRRFIDALVELPLALPTSIAGITLTKIYSDTGIIGSNLAKFGIRISYTRAGIIIAMIFVGIPFVVRNLQPVIEKLNPDYEKAAQILGADKVTIYFKVIFPELVPSLFTGFGMAFARGIGEYGSVVYISGNSAKNNTQVASYIIMQKLNYMDYKGATAVAIVMLIISFTILFGINAYKVMYSRRASCE